MTSESDSENFPIPRSCDVCARVVEGSTYAVIYRVIYGERPHDTEAVVAALSIIFYCTILHTQHWACGVGRGPRWGALGRGPGPHGAGPAFTLHHIRSPVPTMGYALSLLIKRDF